MKKQAFISELRNALERVPDHIREEILADISEHFAEGIAQGMNEEEVCKNLGQPDTIAAQVLEEYGEAPPQPRQHRELNQHRHATKRPGGYDIDIDQSFTNITDIMIKINDGKIRFVPSTDGHCRVTLRGHARHDNFTVANENGTLIISDSAPLFTFNFFRFTPTLVATVYIPPQFPGGINARSNAGNINASGISGRLDAKTAAGNINVDDHHGESVSLRTAAGNATVHLASRRTERVDISTAAGNVKLDAQETGRLSLASAAGSVYAFVRRLGGDTHINTAAGSVDITAYEVAGNIDVSAATGSTKITLPPDANCRIDVKKPALGSLRNDLTGNPQSPYVLRASSGVGSIKLKAL
jgi:hypothetical protein